MASNLANSKTSKVYIKANYENDKITKQKHGDCLPPPWREKFLSFSVNEQGLLFMDNRLVIPKDMRDNIVCAIHYGHAGRDAMLREASDIWCPKVHREIVEKAQNCKIVKEQVRI